MNRQQPAEQRRMHADAGEVVRIGRIVPAIEAVGWIVEGLFHVHAERQGAVGIGLGMEALG